MKKSILRLIPLFFLLAMTVNQPYAQARPTGTKGPFQQAAADCVPGTGWKWVDGPDQPQAAQRAAAELSKVGVSATVKASGYGEVDSCGSYFPRGVDLSITLLESQADGEANIQQALGRLQGVTLGNVRVTSPQGETVTLRPDILQPEQPQATTQAADPTFAKKVYVIAYNPWVDSGHTTRLWDYFHWNSYTEITDHVIDFFKTNSGNQVQYQVVDTSIIDEIPRKADGYQYTIQEYIDVINHVKESHQPDGVNYNLIVNDPRLDICGKANRGEIDEVWVFNGPYYGFWESTLVGPDAYWYNSPPVPGPFTCTRTIPIMGPNPERWVSEFVEDFGHRTESTMTRVYNWQWEQNHTRNSWEKFALVKSQSPNYNYSGCGDVHFPPNGESDYDWGNPGSAQTYCDDFANYPNLHAPTTVLKPVTCSTWDCDSLTYFAWWYSHYPKYSGCGPDSVANNWWVYFAYPELALDPVKGCKLDLPYSLFVPAIRRK